LWRDGVRVQHEQGAPTVWAFGAGAQVSFGLPTETKLQFRFRCGDPVYRKLVSTTNLRANIVVDRVSRQILGVTFRGRA
jgi:hypothetical protein